MVDFSTQVISIILKIVLRSQTRQCLRNIKREKEKRDQFNKYSKICGNHFRLYIQAIYVTHQHLNKHKTQNRFVFVLWLQRFSFTVEKSPYFETCYWDSQLKPKWIWSSFSEKYSNGIHITRLSCWYCLIFLILPLLSQ